MGWVECGRGGGELVRAGVGGAVRWGRRWSMRLARTVLRSLGLGDVNAEVGLQLYVASYLTHIK